MHEQSLWVMPMHSGDYNIKVEECHFSVVHVGDKRDVRQCPIQRHAVVSQVQGEVVWHCRMAASGPASLEERSRGQGGLSRAAGTSCQVGQVLLRRHMRQDRPCWRHDGRPPAALSHRMQPGSVQHHVLSDRPGKLPSGRHSGSCAASAAAKRSGDGACTLVTLSILAAVIGWQGSAMHI